MSGKDFLPHAIVAFFAWLIKFYARLVIAELDIPEAPKVALMEKITLFRVLYEKAEDPTTARAVDIHARNAARKELEAELREFVNAYIRYNPAISDAERELLGVTSPSHEHHPAPVPTGVPECHISMPHPCQLTFDFFDPERRGKAKPEGVHGCEMKWGFRDTMPDNADDLNHSTFDTHTPVTLTFEVPQRGKTVWFMLRWENTRGEKGPWSLPVSAVIP